VSPDFGCDKPATRIVHQVSLNRLLGAFLDFEAGAMRVPNPAARTMTNIIGGRPVQYRPQEFGDVKLGIVSPTAWQELRGMKEGAQPDRLGCAPVSRSLANYLYFGLADFAALLLTPGTPASDPCCSRGPRNRVSSSSFNQNNCPPLA
jgi:hypothetical protein